MRCRELIKPDSIELFEKYSVFSERELHSRYEVRLEMYALTIGVEAKLALELGIDGHPARGDPLSDRVGAERLGAEEGGHGAGYDAAGGRQHSDLGADRCADGIEGGAGGTRRRLRRRRGQARAERCCLRWMRSVRPPTRWRVLWPTICGRCRRIRRCSTSFEHPMTRSPSARQCPPRVGIINPQPSHSAASYS